MPIDYFATGKDGWDEVLDNRGCKSVDHVEGFMVFLATPAPKPALRSTLPEKVLNGAAWPWAGIRSQASVSILSFRRYRHCHKKKYMSKLTNFGNW